MKEGVACVSGDQNPSSLACPYLFEQHDWFASLDSEKILLEIDASLLRRLQKWLIDSNLGNLEL